MNLKNREQTYGWGSWQSPLPYNAGAYWFSTFVATSGITHFYAGRDIENGPREVHKFTPGYHDHTLFFEGGKNYMISDIGELCIVKLKNDLSRIKEENQKFLIKMHQTPYVVITPYLKIRLILNLLPEGGIHDISFKPISVSAAVDRILFR